MDIETFTCRLVTETKKGLSGKARHSLCVTFWEREDSWFILFAIEVDGKKWEKGQRVKRDDIMAMTEEGHGQMIGLLGNAVASKLMSAVVENAKK